jgi:hypothetical protein
VSPVEIATSPKLNPFQLSNPQRHQSPLPQLRTPPKGHYSSFTANCPLGADHQSAAMEVEGLGCSAQLVSS